jgi:hypothetical protein
VTMASASIPKRGAGRDSARSPESQSSRDEAAGRHAIAKAHAAPTASVGAKSGTARGDLYELATRPMRLDRHAEA